MEATSHVRTKGIFDILPSFLGILAALQHLLGEESAALLNVSNGHSKRQCCRPNNAKKLAEI
jgi:hypothetical protein